MALANASASASKPNTHLSDPLLAPFLTPVFSPTSYLNSTLPSAPSTTTKPSSTTLSSLASLTSQTQSQINTLSAQTARLGTTLTALTDDILRCSSRLAYEVELLRGEASGLVEALEDDGEKDDSLGAAMKKFMPPASTSATAEGLSEDAAKQLKSAPNDATKETLDRLRTLLHVKARLQQTTQTFNSALSFPMPPSLLASTASSIISISAPDASTNATQDEQRGQAAIRNMRREITDLLTQGNEGEIKARKRIEDLREIVSIWKGTSEEKARGKVVDGLEALVEEAVEKRVKASGRTKAPAGGIGLPIHEESRSSSAAGGASKGGFLGGLQRLREEIYMD